MTVPPLQSRSYCQVSRYRGPEDLQRVPAVGTEAIERLYLTVCGESCPLNLERRET